MDWLCSTRLTLPFVYIPLTRPPTIQQQCIVDNDRDDSWEVHSPFAIRGIAFGAYSVDVSCTVSSIPFKFPLPKLARTQHLISIHTPAGSRETHSIHTGGPQSGVSSDSKATTKKRSSSSHGRGPPQPSSVSAGAP